MGLLSNLFSATKHFTFIKPPGFSFQDHVNPAFDPDSTITSLLTCQKILSEYLAKLPIEVYKSNPEKGKQKEKGHPLYNLLHNDPNDWQTSTLFFQMLEFWRNKYGNSWAKIYRDRAGKAERLELIKPSEIIGYKFKNGQLYWLREMEIGKREVLNNMEVLHFRFASEDGVMGLTPGQVLIRELENIYQGKTTLNHAYKNNLNIDKYFETNVMNFSTPQAQANIAEIQANYSGSLNVRKTPFLPAGFKLVSIPAGNIQDAQILESLKFSKADIYELFGIPLPEKKAYNSIEQETLNFKTNTLQPIARMYRQELEKKLLFDADRKSDTSIEFNLSAVVEVDMKTRIDYLMKLKGGAVINANDIARMEGFETYEGGELHFIQSQNIPVEEYEKYAKAGQSQPLPPKNEENEQD